MSSISENILLFISGLGILQAILLACLIYFHPRSERSINKFLALYIVCISIPMLLPLAQHFFSWQTFVFLAPFALLQGPLLYLYIRSFKEVITFKKAWPHFLFFAGYFLIVGSVSLFVGSKYPSGNAIPPEVLHNPATFIPISIRWIQMTVYYFIARKELRSYQRSIQHLFSETSRIDLSWVKLLVNGYMVLVFSAIALYSMLLYYADQFSLFILINTAIASPYIYMATYKGIYQTTLWQLKPNMSPEKVEEEMQEAEKIESINEKEHIVPEVTEKAVDDKTASLVSKIILVMEQERLYLEPELTLQNLSDKLKAPSYQVSLALNEGMKKNFYDLVNGYRVEEAKRLLVDEKSRSFTILSVGFEAGFNSKTTFNTVFKKFTGLTPTEFRQKQKGAIPV